jgi:hypothetical protein
MYPGVLRIGESWHIDLYRLYLGQSWTNQICNIYGQLLVIQATKLRHICGTRLASVPKQSLQSGRHVLISLGMRFDWTY